MVLQAVVSQQLITKALGIGMRPVTEILLNTPIVKKLLEKGKIEKLPLAIEAGQHDGMQTYNQNLLKLINAGEISEGDGLAASPLPETLKMNLKEIV